MNYMMHGFETIANSLAMWLAPIGPTYYDEPDWFSTIESAYNATEGKFLLPTYTMCIIISEILSSFIFLYFSVIGIGEIFDQRLMKRVHHNYTKCGKVVC